MSNTAPPSTDDPTPPAFGPRRTRRGAAVVAATLLLAGPVAYLALGSGATSVGSGAAEPVSAEVLVQSALPGAAHIDTKGSSDIEIVRLTIKQAQATAWHSHSGPALASISRGTAALYLGGDSGCTRRRYDAGDAFLVSPGKVHAIRNEGRGTLVIHDFSILPKGSEPGTLEQAPAGCAFSSLPRSVG
ncbi:MAG TPA: cupin domain-containing protein [Solirubrobacteraceae bacterium]